MSLFISNQVRVDDSEFEWHAVRASGAGGQNVNKVATAIHLRFDIAASSLPDVYISVYWRAAIDGSPVTAYS